MEKIKSLKGYWVCVTAQGHIDTDSIAGTKSQSKKKWVRRGPYKWREWKTYSGMRCIKVNIDFTPVK